MLFSSITFLYYFLPAMLLVYFIAPKDFRNAVLVLFSLLFYAWGEPKYVFLMTGTIFAGYFAGLIIGRYRGSKFGKITYLLALFVCLFLLAYFKYADFFIKSFSDATGLSVKLLNIALPIGISFYTFQLISYIIDVYRGDVEAQKDPVKLFAYISMFPQLIAGPIVRYRDIEKTLSERGVSFDSVREGIIRFAMGLGKKVIIANQLAGLCDIVKTTDNNSVLFMWTYAVAAALHIYFDFSGYSDMAIGLGKILGFTFPENFDYPYISGTITEFWRRWHMTLGSWFRDYVYIPMGGSRVGKVRLIFNLFIVWMLTGLWHGAAWNFVLWGLLFAVLLILEKLFFYKSIDKTRVFKHIYVIFIVLISFVIFSGDSLSQIGTQLLDMFGFGGLPLVSEVTIYYLRSYMVIILLGILGATPLVKRLYKWVKGKAPIALVGVLEPIVVIGILLLSTAYLVDGSFNPFLYFRF